MLPLSTREATSSVGHQMGTAFGLQGLFCLRLTTRKERQPEGGGSKENLAPLLQVQIEGFVGEKCLCAWPFRHFRKLIRSDDAAT